MNAYTLKATEMSVYLLPLLPITHRGVGVCRNNQHHVNYSAFMMGRVPMEFNSTCLKSRTPAQGAGCSTAKLSASCPALVKAEPGPPRSRVPWPKPTTHWVLSNSQKSVLTWETFPWTQVKPRNRPGSGANVAKYSTKPEISGFFSSPLLPFLDFFLSCQSILSAEIFQIAKLEKTFTTIMIENVHIWVLMRRVCIEPFIQQWWKLYCINIAPTTLFFFVQCISFSSAILDVKHTRKTAFPVFSCRTTFSGNG